MELPQSIEYRDVRRVRLEIGKSGVRLILPKGYPEKPESVLFRHRRWIERRMRLLETAIDKVSDTQIRRTEQQLRILVREAIAGSYTILQKNPSSVRFRHMRTRWGTCSSAGRITFSKNLKYLPEDLVEYVVHHEMCHLAEMSHRSAFWLLVEAKYPAFRDFEQRLKMHGLALA